MASSQKILYKNCRIYVSPYRLGYAVSGYDETGYGFNHFCDIPAQEVENKIAYVKMTIDISRRLQAARLCFARWLGKAYQKHPEERVVDRIIDRLHYRMVHYQITCEAEIRHAYHQGTLGVLVMKHDFHLFQNLYTQYRHAKEKQSTILHP